MLNKITNIFITILLMITIGSNPLDFANASKDENEFLSKVEINNYYKELVNKTKVTENLDDNVKGFESFSDFFESESGRIVIVMNVYDKNNYFNAIAYNEIKDTYCLITIKNKKEIEFRILNDTYLICIHEINNINVSNGKETKPISLLVKNKRFMILKFLKIINVKLNIVSISDIEN